MYLSNNYVDINIYPLTMKVMRLWACLYGKGAISNNNIIIMLLLLLLLLGAVLIFLFVSRRQHMEKLVSQGICM